MVIVATNPDNLEPLYQIPRALHAMGLSLMPAADDESALRALAIVFTWIIKLLRLGRRQPSDRIPLESSPTRADNGPNELEACNRALARPPAGAASPHPSQPDSSERGREHGVRRGSSGSEIAGDGTRTPRHATRYVETRLGVLSYAELAPHLARNVLALELRIENGEFAQAAPADALLLDLHHLICGDLVPQLAGWRRTNVTIGAHTPADFFRVPALVREYGLDLQARLSGSATTADDLLLETLAFAEGRLLSIHPFSDFNGRVTRVWLREILRRLELPPVQLATAMESSRDEYLTALRAADRNDWRPLMGVWRRRFEEGAT